MSVAVKKLEGVQSVDVSLEKASADIVLRADNKITIEAIRRTIRSNGYQTKDAAIEARGKIVERDGKMLFDLLNGASIEIAAGTGKAPRDTTLDISGVVKLLPKGGDQLTLDAVR